MCIDQQSILAFIDILYMHVLVKPYNTKKVSKTVKNCTKYLYCSDRKQNSGTKIIA